VSTAPIRYQSAEEDSGRWAGFEFREGDIVISTRSKSGTTWMQMICALLIFQTSDLPAPLGELSPWLDWLVAPREKVFAQLAAQEHRRFIKTHTPLDGVPLDPCATYIVVARHPLDMAVSVYYQGENIDRARMRQLTGQPATAPAARPPLRDWLLGWIDSDADPRAELDSLPGVMWHLSDAWSRRSQPNVVIVHYADLLAGLETQMRQLAELLEMTIPTAAWPALVQAATFEQMRAGSGQILGHGGVLKNTAAFFRRGTSGAGREQLTGVELAHYNARAADMAPRDLLTWLHRES
jgi:aryl sulfotransferase